VGDVLVDHDSIEHDRILNLASGDLLDLGVTLDVDRLRAVLVHGDGADRLKSELAHLVGPARDELGTEGSFDESEHLGLVARVDGDGDGLDDEEGLLEGALEGRDDDDWVDVALNVGKSLGENLSGCLRAGRRVDQLSSSPKTRSFVRFELTEDDDTGRSVSDLLVLSPRELNHALGSRMSDLNLTKNRVAVVGEPGSVRKGQLGS
jgi:hypothetical protein